MVSVAVQIARLPDASMGELREMWREIFSGDSPHPNNRQFMAQRIAHQLQVNRYGSLDELNRKRLSEHAEDLPYTLRIEYVMPGEDTADAVTVQFFNSRTWKQDEVTSALPDSGAEQPATVALFGCTDEDQAEREGLYMAAANRYRRRLITFQTELEGMIPTYGDLIAVSHDMPRWGQAGEVVAWDDPALTLSEPVEFSETGPHYIVLRKRDGGVSGPWEVLPGEDAQQVVLQEEPDITPFTGASEERTHFAFGKGEAWAVLARVTGVKPRGNLVEISCVAENPLVHTADEI